MPEHTEYTEIGTRFGIFRVFSGRSTFFEYGDVLELTLQTANC